LPYSDANILGFLLENDRDFGSYGVAAYIGTLQLQLGASFAPYAVGPRNPTRLIEQRFRFSRIVGEMGHVFIQRPTEKRQVAVGRQKNIMRRVMDDFGAVHHRNQCLTHAQIR